MANAVQMTCLLPLPEVAKALGVSVHTVRRLIGAGSLKSVNIGARVMISAEEVARVQRDGVGTPRKTREA